MRPKVSNRADGMISREASEFAGGCAVMAGGAALAIISLFALMAVGLFTMVVISAGDEVSLARRWIVLLWCVSAMVIAIANTISGVRLVSSSEARGFVRPAILSAGVIAVGPWTWALLGV